MTLALVLAGLGLAGGYLLGRGSRPEPPTRLAADFAPAPGVGAEIQAILIDPDPLVRTAKLAERLQTLGPDALADVRRAFDSLVIDAGDPELALLAEWWARFEPAECFAWALDELRESHPAVVAGAVRAWARRDPLAARDAVHARIRERALLRTSLSALVGGWEEGGRPGLWEYLETLPQGIEQQVAIEKLVRRKLRRAGVEETLRWAEALPRDLPGDPARPKLNAMRRAAGAVAEIDPLRAARWVEEQPEGRSSAGMYRRVAIAWVGRDGEAAMRWLATLPPGPQRDSAVAEGFRTWVGHERDAAYGWLRAQPGEPWLDPALALYAGSLSQRDHREALDWARRIRDERRRSQTIRRIAASWLREDPDAAGSWIEGAGLPEGDVEWILATEKRRRSGAVQRRAGAQGATGARAAPGNAPGTRR